jgi:hypothetical protein
MERNDYGGFGTPSTDLYMQATDPNFVPNAPTGLAARRTKAMEDSAYGSQLKGYSGLVGASVGAYDMLFNQPDRQKLAEQKFNFERGLANRNLANQAALANEELQRKRGVGLAMSGLSAADREAYTAANPVTQVSGEEIVV